MSRDILKLLRTAEIVAVRCRGTDWPRSLLSETLIPDAWMGMVTKADGRRRLVPAGEDPHAEREDALVLVRNRALTVPLDLAHLAATDGHDVRGTVELLIRVTARDDELAAFQAHLLARDELTLADLATAMEQGGARSALEQFVRAQTARELVHGDIRDNLCSYVRGQINRFLFSAGLFLERLGRVEFASPSLLHEEDLSRTATRRVKEIESRKLVEQAALAATQRRLAGLSDVFGKLKAATAGEAASRWRDLLPALAPGERGRLLENLWRLTPDREVAAALVVVAGLECVWLDPQQPDAIMRRVTLAEDLGGLRSVNWAADAKTLLVGAARGVWRLSPDDGTVLGQHAVPGGEMVRTGFNAAAIAGERLCATHSQLGAWCWNLRDPADVQALVQPTAGAPRTIRAATTDAYGRMLVALDDRVCVFASTGELVAESAASDSAIHDLAVLEDSLYAGTEAGALLRADLKAPGQWTLLHRAANPVESIDVRRWDDLVELVIPAGTQGVLGVYATEGVVCRLLDAAVSIRRVWACDDTLVALAEQRDRLVVLNGSMPARTGREVPMARLLGRSLQDVCIVTRPAEQAEAGT